jgi:hypothetical protein
MFCKWCGKVAFVRGGPVAAHGCPVCEGSFFGGQEKVSRDDDPPGDDRSSSNDDDSSSEYSASPVDVSYSSDDASSSEYSYSPSSSTSSPSDGGGGIVLVILLVVGLIIAALLSGKNSDQQSAPVATVMPLAPNQSPPATAPQPQPVYLFQNTLPGTYNMGQEGNQQQSEANNPYCGSVAAMAWYFAEFCRDPELAALNKQVTRLDSIQSMIGHTQPINSFFWQQAVDRKCKEAQSPPDCLRSALEDRSQLLRADITEELASDRPGLFKDEARKLWE